MDIQPSETDSARRRAGLEALEPRRRRGAARRLPRRRPPAAGASAVHPRGAPLRAGGPAAPPGMAAVVVMLNSRSVTLPAPSAPAFVSASRGIGGSPPPAAAAGDAPARSTDHEVPTAAR